MESYLKKIQDRIQTIYNHGMGFTASDFTDLADYKTISKTLERLEDAVDRPRQPAPSTPSQDQRTPCAPRGHSPQP